MKDKKKNRRAIIDFASKRFHTFALLCVALLLVGLYGVHVLHGREYKIAMAQFEAAATSACNALTSPVIFEANVAIDENDTTCENFDITVGDGITGRTLTVDGTHTFAALTITNASTLTHTASDSSTAFKKMNLTITGAFNVNSGAFVDVNGKGCPASFKLNGAETICSAAGETHGSHAGAGNGSALTEIYDSPNNPTLPGAGSVSFGRIGGGVVIVAANTITVDGTVRANPSGDQAAAGTINLQATGVLSGSGTIEARNPGGSGSAGRVALKGSDVTFPTANVDLDASSVGAHGTLYIEKTGTSSRTLLFDAYNLSNDLTLLDDDQFTGVATNTVDVIIQNGRLLMKDSNTFKSLTLTSSGVLAHPSSTTSSTEKINLTVTGDITVNSGTFIDVNGRGCPGNQKYNSSNGLCDAGADTNGSFGGVAVSASEDAVYGLIDNPTQPGSGSTSFGRSGGGVIILSAANVVVDGTIRSNPSGDQGAAGSVKITASGTISGSGTIEAKNTGSGGAGRIALTYGTLTLPIANVNATSTSSGAGTVYLKDSGNPVLRIETSGNKVATPINAALFTNSTVPTFDEIIIDKAYAVLNTDVTATTVTVKRTSDTFGDKDTLFINNVKITGDVHVESGGVLAHPASTTGTTYKLVAEITGTLTIDSGGGIYLTGRGCPGNQKYNTSNGLCDTGSDTYGSHGGAGDTMGFDKIYGAIDNPATPGSGSTSFGRSGGGILFITAANIVNNGLIQVKPSGDQAAGGSVKLVATSTISGSGDIEVHSAGSGGGGRVALIADTITFPEANVTLGTSTGGAGTLYVNETSGSTKELTIDSNGTLNDNTTIKAADFESVQPNEVDLTVDAARLLFTGDSNTFKSVTLTNSAQLSHPTTTASATYKLNLTVVNTLTVNTGTSITTVGRGCPGDKKFNTVSGLCDTAADTHASHGGYGNGESQTDVYGSVEAPNYPGSGSNSFLRSGGGVINITAGNLTNNGDINADAGGSQGAGGSVYLKSSGTITGSGTVSADAGAGSGGGGRVAIIYDDADTALGLTLSNLTAVGYDSSGPNTPGTVYIDTIGTTLTSTTGVLGIGNDISFAYNLFTKDSSGLGTTNYSITPEYSTDGGSNWSNMTDAGGASDGKTSLTAATGAGNPLTFIWDADGDGVTSGSALVRMRAQRNPIGDGFITTVCTTSSCGATADVEDPTGINQGNVTINFKLYDNGSASTGVTVTYSDDGGSTFNTATSAGSDSCTSGGGTASPCPLSHTTSPGGTSHTFKWNTVTDLGLVEESDIVIKIQPTGGTADQTTTFIVDNNAAPSVSLTSPSSCGTQTGNLTINYTITDAASDTVGVKAEYSLNSGSTWDIATSAGGDSGISGLASSPGGTAHTFKWDTATDVAFPKTTVKFRITASDTDNGFGSPATSTTFGVNNSSPASASITDPTTAAGDSVSFSYTLTDSASQTLSITPRYSIDGGDNYSTATEKTSGVTPASDGTSSLTSSPGGTSHLFVWDTGTDLASSATGVLFQIEPNDGNAGICGDTSAFNYSKGGGTDLPDVAPTAPIMGVPDALTTSSIKWNFTDTADNESGFKILDTNDVVKVTTEPVSTSDIESLTETGLTANTQYTRKVIAFGSAGDSDASATASIYTLAEVPNSVLPLYLTDTQIEVNIDGVIDVNTPFEVAQRIAAAEELSELEDTSTLQDSGGQQELEASADTTALTATVSEKFLQDYPGQTAYYFQATNQTSGNVLNSGWVSQSFWRFNGMQPSISYEVKVKARNGDGVETAFSVPKIITTLATSPPKMSLALNVGINVGGAAAIDALPAKAYTTGQVEEGLDNEALIEGRDPQAVTYASTNRNYVFGGVALAALFLFLLYVRMFGGLHSNTPLWEKKTFILKKIAKLLRAKWIMFTHHPVHAFEKLALRTENGEFLSSYHEYHKHHKSHNRIVVGVALLIAGFVSFYGVVGMELGVSAAALYADNGKEVYRGDTVTYQIIYKNSGTKPATSVEIRNPISSAVNFVAGSVKHNNQTIQVTPAGGSLNIPIGQVNGAQSGVIEFKVSIPQTAPQPGLLINQASVAFAESSLSVVSNQTYNPINAPLNPADLTQRRDGIDSVYEQFTLNNQGVVRHLAPSSETTEDYIPQIVEPEIPPEVPEEPVVPEPETPTEPDEPTGVDIIGDTTPPAPTESDANAVSPPSQSTPNRQTISSGGTADGAFSLNVGDGGEIQINGEIIQQEDAVLVRGTGTPGAILEIAVDEFNQFFTTVDEDGNWAVTLDHRNLVGGALEGEVLTFDVSVQVQKDEIVSERVRLGEITLLTRVDGADVIGFGEPDVIRGDNVVEQTLSAIGLGIRKSVEQLGEVVEPIEDEAQVTLSVAAPILIISNPAIASNLPFLYTYLYHGISWLLGALGVRRNRKESWGVVYDAISKDPISLAIVRLYAIKDEGDTRGKLKETTVTDAKGRFTFLVEPGIYRLEVQKAGYRYPSQIVVNTKIDAEYTNVYDGKTIQLAASAQEGGAPTIKADIPLDPETAAQKAQRSFGIKKILLETQHAVSKVATPILSVGAIAAGLLTLGSFNATNAIIFWLYIFFALLQYVFKPVKMKSWGVVYDAATGEPVPLAVVNIIDPKFQKLIKTRLTDYQGRYNFLPSKGEYVMQIRKEGYTFPAQGARPTKKYKQPYKGENFKVAKNQGIVSKDIPIQKQ